MEHESESPPSRIVVNDDIDKSDDCESMNSLLTHRWHQQPIANIRITRDDEMMSALSPADEEQVVDDAAAVMVESYDRPSQKHQAGVDLADGAEAEAQVAEEPLSACSTSASKREIITTTTSTSSSRRRRKSRKRNISSSSHNLIFAMVALLLCTSSLHQSVLAVKTTDDADTRSNNGNGIQRKRGGGGAKRESLQEQFQRITNHRRLDRQHQQGRQQLVANGPPLSSAHSRTLQGDKMVCTCSPQIFNIKITLTSTDPCTTDDLKPNNGIENTLCLFTNPTEGLYPPVPAPVVPVEETTMQPTATDTNDPFRPPNGGSGGGGSGATMPPKPGFPTYSPTSSTYAPTITGMPITPFPSFVPTKSDDDDERMAQKRPDSGRGSGGSGGGGGGGEPTYHPTIPWPTFSPTTNPTPYSDDDDNSGAKPRGGRGGWLDEGNDEDGMPSLRSMSLDDDDELIEPHHHRHHHHRHSPTFTEDENDGGSRKLESSASGRKRMLQVINVDELVHDSGVIMSGEDNKDGATKNDDDGSNSNSNSNSNKGKEVKPSYYQPPAAAVHQSTLDTWTSIPPNDVFFNKHPELKSYQEELYRMKHGLPSSSSTSTSSSTVASSVTTRSLQGQVQGGLMPTRLISAQFLEMDTSSNMQIINQDDQYLNVTFPDPSNIVLQFSSISNLLNPAMPLSDQMEYVPGGAILILVGATASGEIVRNRMLWTYTMGCGLDDYTVLDGNVIGWAGFENLTPAREEFCPSSGNLPPPATPSPSAAPTSTPSAPTTKPPTATSEPTTKAPSMDMPSTMPPTKKPSSSKSPTTKKPSMSMGSGDIFDHFDLSGKSKKKKKKQKNKRGMDERELDTMKEDFRTLRRRETVMEFGRPFQ
eukprot:scaffold20073_cov95-Skeletonema_marinoi.AAC.2